MRNKILFAALALVVVFADASYAVGALYARRAGSQDSSYALWLERYDATVTITDQMAVTHVDQTFKNESSTRLEGIFIFPLPENAIVTELALWINGVRTVAQVMESDTARAVYNGIVRRSIDPALLEYLGNNVFKLSVFPIDPVGSLMCERRIEITYAELLPYDAANIKYNFFMKAVNMSSKAVERTSLKINLSSQKQILSLGSSTHTAAEGLVISQASQYSDTILYGEENTISQKDFTLYYKLKNDNYAISHLTYVPKTDGTGMFFDSTGDKPYFLLWITPPDTVTQAQIIKKNLVFVADVSSSMAGARIDQLRLALNAMVDMLNPGDKFNIIAFASGVSAFKPDLVDFSVANTAAAHTFVNALGAVGMTNMEGAFKTALAASWVDTCMNAIVFLTDGMPTWPVTSTAATVIDSVGIYNPLAKVSIYPFGVGDVDKGFLKLLAKRNNGFSLLMSASDSISIALESFMQKISHPVIKNISVNYGGISQNDVYPPNAPNVYANSQLTLMGRYSNAGTFPITVTGSVGSNTMTLSANLPFPSTVMPNQPFVPRMWASAKINYLLDDIAIYGEQTELVNAVKLLGRKYSIITPYTSMIVVEPGLLVEDKTLPPAKVVRLCQGFPNPFIASTMIQFSIPRSLSAQRMSLQVFDASGRLVRTLINEYTMGGSYRIQWNALDNYGRKVSPGFYLVVLKVGNASQMIKVRFVK
jgi:Ca-activated chloride channel family protein